MTSGRWLAVATRPDVVRRSVRIALVVGTILVAVNYIDKIVALEIGGTEILKIVLTYLVPYCVSTYASVQNTLHDRASSIRG